MHDTVGDIKHVNICLDTFVHHYIRLTPKVKYLVVKDLANLISIEDKCSLEIRKNFQTMND